ncbi:hypothetical protein IQ03_04509 [Gemmobacter caeni]|uniref:Uncharacterized protein n=1 Tax=Gemmobacter caeni TaxID=589035 RepID=A0A2T6AP91_9RHOB|nr:hypothetical protein [Gemmobacter caeni]PTX45600.1 hypothetical protein C8N34_12130 [Gemmobacter caeni]TWI93748.1 hypothetical protein IQ03_04509 [Gemmobacter caeni]
MADTPTTPETELTDYRETLLAIARHTPTCSPESDEAFSQQAWNGLFRDMQRLARVTLTRYGHKP